MRPANLKTRIFLDGGDPRETRQAITLLGFLDGQTTNPTLISKNPQASKRLDEGGQFSKEEIFEFYKSVVWQIHKLIPDGSISVEVYADAKTHAEEMFIQGRQMFSWIPNAHIKYPTNREGLEAAQKSIAEGLRVNMTLCFSQKQAAAVYGATKGAQKGGVFVSPFVGRLDDIGINGMDLTKNIIRMYSSGDGHVEVLTASIRNLDHFLYALALGSDIITAPFKVLKEWADNGMEIPDENYAYMAGNLNTIPYEQLDLEKNWQEFDIYHQLTEKGIEKFANDWNSAVVKWDS